MRFCQVLGNVTQTIHHPTYDGTTLLICQPLDENQKHVGNSFLAVDHAQAGPGDRVLVCSFGRFGQLKTEIARRVVEADSAFYGAMDGASKFAKGDAVAGLLITGINIVIGLLMGVLVHDLPIGDAFHSYTLLTVGDGLVGGAGNHRLDEHAFKRAAGVEDIARLLGRGLGDGGTLVGYEFDETLMRQALQSLADHRAAEGHVQGRGHALVCNVRDDDPHA